MSLGRTLKISALLIILGIIASTIYLTSINPVSADTVVVLSSSTFTDSSGILHVVGEVQNTGSDTVSSVEVAATFYNSSSNIVYTQISSSSPFFMLPNSKSPFNVKETILTLIPQIKTYKLRVSFTPADSIQQGLEITSSTSRIDSAGVYHLVGEIQNIGMGAATTTEIYATFYDSSGKVVDTSYAFADSGRIASGDSSSFDITVNDLSQIPLISSYSLNADSNEYALVTSSSSTQTPTSFPTYQSSPTPTPTVPEITTLNLVALLIVMLLVSAITLSVKKRKKNQD